MRHNESYAKYEQFQILDEGGARPAGETVPYLVPRSGEHHIALPTSFFENGWIYVLEDSEIAFLLMLFHLHKTISTQFWVKAETYERLAHFGIGRDAYGAHEVLKIFGLIDVQIGANRRPDGRIFRPASYPDGDRPLNRFMLTPEGFENLGQASAIAALRGLI
ncbi:hypothetical protein Pth03_11550 [Planotetraspora thailandica]|uniref:Uncharacterized protein n=1 Tax=Planotetraspora thailandica TaxID=487172 RepID=A0A8J3UXN9_9ACTN|nr:hypothetical protein [Planotetraspora thailandica]GII52766.1 hypothetical protein Pth03_11550 [Planotetraspora thailandica]